MFSGYGRRHRHGLPQMGGLGPDQAAVAIYDDNALNVLPAAAAGKLDADCRSAVCRVAPNIVDILQGAPSTSASVSRTGYPGVFLTSCPALRAAAVLLTAFPRFLASLRASEAVISSAAAGDNAPEDG